MPTLGKVNAVVTDPPYGVLPDKWDSFSDQGFNIFNAGWMSIVARQSEKAFIFSGSTRGEIETMARLLYKNVRRLVWDKGSSGTGNGKFWFCYEEFFMCDNEKPKEFAEPKDLIVAGIVKKAREEAGISRGGVDQVVRGKKTGLCYRWEEGACLPTLEQEEKLSSIMNLEKHGYQEAISKAREVKKEVLEVMRSSNSENGSEISDVLKFNVDKYSDHPCEKPKGLMSTIVSTTDAETILDPFMGSGTTGVACVNLGRKFIGIELEEKYFDIACKRIDQANRQGKLFTPPKPKPEQQGMF
jgi:DNA modification methylase